MSKFIAICALLVGAWYLDLGSDCNGYHCPPPISSNEVKDTEEVRYARLHL